MKKSTVLSLLALMLAANAHAQHGEVEMKAGCGDAAPYAAAVKLHIEDGKFTFKPFAGVRGITRYTSGQVQDETYTFTGVMPLSQTQGTQYLSHQTTEAQGTTATYGFQLSYRPAERHLLTLNVKGEDTHREESGSLSELLLSPTGGQMTRNRWQLDAPLLCASRLEVGAGYTYRMPHEDITVSYQFKRDGNEEEKRMEGESLDGFTDFSRSVLRTDAFVLHHDLRLSYDNRLPFGDFHMTARYENRLLHSDDRQWLDARQSLDARFRHQYQTEALMARYTFHPVRHMDVMAALEYAYTTMEGKKLHDLLPTGRVTWRMNDRCTWALGYVRKLVRPSLSLLNPAELRRPFTLYQGNKDLEGVHSNRFSLDFDWRLPMATWHLTAFHIFSDDGFNGLWMERGNCRIYRWGNEGVRRAWGIMPSLDLRVGRTTKLEANATLLWDKRIAEAVGMAHERWGINSRLAVSQSIGKTVRLTAYGEYGEGNPFDLYRYGGKGYALGTSLSKRFCQHLQGSVRYQYRRDADDVYTMGGFLGHFSQRPAHRNACSLSLTYQF